MITNLAGVACITTWKLKINQHHAMLYVTQSSSWMEVRQPTIIFPWGSKRSVLCDETLEKSPQSTCLLNHMIPCCASWEIVSLPKDRWGWGDRISRCGVKMNPENCGVNRDHSNGGIVEPGFQLIYSSGFSRRRNVILSTEWGKIPTGYNKEFHTFESTKQI